MTRGMTIDLLLRIYIGILIEITMLGRYHAFAKKNSIQPLIYFFILIMRMKFYPIGMGLMVDCCTYFMNQVQERGRNQHILF